VICGLRLGRLKCYKDHAYALEKTTMKRIEYVPKGKVKVYKKFKNLKRLLSFFLFLVITWPCLGQNRTDQEDRIKRREDSTTSRDNTTAYRENTTTQPVVVTRDDVTLYREELTAYPEEFAYYISPDYPTVILLNIHFLCNSFIKTVSPCNRNVPLSEIEMSPFRRINEEEKWHID
jgi:hypothetical protein